MTDKDRILLDKNIPLLKEAAEKAYKSGDENNFIDIAYNITDELETMDNMADAVEPLFKVYEESPDIDFGGPGPIGSFVEKAMAGEEYEKLVIESLKRKPTNQMIFMLCRILNDYDNPRRDNYIPFIKTFENAEFLDDFWRDVIKDDY